MTELPSWTYTGVVPLDGDLSLLEAALHSGRVSAAERGYTGEPEIGTEQVMAAGPATPGEEPEYLTAEQAAATGVDFVPTSTRYQLSWAPETDQG